VKPADHYRGREQTYLKHFFLERVAYKVGSSSEFVYVDGFSGPWKTEDPGCEDSSFVIAINKLRQVREGLARIDRRPSWTGFGLRQIASILRHKPGEVLVNFMFDHINRFLDAPEPEMSFDDLFGGTGWKPAITASPTREDAIITLYGDRMKATGAFDFVTSTRIKKPLSERSYFYLVYGTRHPEGLLEFRRVEEREILEQERVRMDAQHLERVKRTGQAELFGADDFPDVGPTSFEAERRENLRRAEERLVRILQGGTEVRYELARAAMMEVPLVWETDVQRIVKDRADVIGMTKRERVPKPGHRLKLKSVQ
jgi:hypothetical protein